MAVAALREGIVTGSTGLFLRPQIFSVRPAHYAKSPLFVRPSRADSSRIRAVRYRKHHEPRQQCYASFRFSPPPGDEVVCNNVTRTRYREVPHPVSEKDYRRLIRCQAQSAISVTSDLDSSPSETATVTTKALRLVVPLVGVAAFAAGVRANWRFFSSEWFLTILAKLIGYILITASTVLKLPQIIRIVRSNSIEGLSVPSFEMECVGYTISLLFCWTRRVPFSAYGELFFLVLQSLILMLLIYFHSPRLGRQRYLRAGIYMGMVALLLSPAMRPDCFEALYNGQTALFTLSRLPQMWQNFVSASTGQLSLTTSAMSAAGCAARFFTSIQERAPFSMVIASTAGFMAHGVLLAQILAYSKPAIQATQQTAADTKQAALPGIPASGLPPPTASE